MKKCIYLFLVGIIYLCIFLTGCQKSVDNSASDIAALKDAVIALQKRSDSLALALKNNNNNYGNLSKSVDSIRIQLVIVTSQISTLTLDLTTQNANIGLINSQISDLNAKYNDLLSKLNALLIQLNASSPFKYGIGFYYTGPDSSSSYAYAYDTTKWHYIALTVDTSRQVQIYLDGIKQVDYYRTNLNYVYSNINLAVDYYTSYKYFYNGLMDELRISNRVRTQREIQDYYALSVFGGGIGSLGIKNPAQTLDAYTTALYHFDDVTGVTTLKNSVPNSAQGTLYGSCKFLPGISGNAIYFDGISSRASCNTSLNSSPFTIELWFKSNTNVGSTLVDLYGMYTSDIYLHPL